ncbi:MAG: thioesterase [Clostridia bacterium]
MREFKKEYIVGAGETDCKNECRPSALLNFMQDAATTHAGIIGLSRDTLVLQNGAIWILTRCKYELSRPIAAFETIGIETWHRGLRGAMWYRDFSITAGGVEIGRAINAWVLADVTTHRAMRPTGMEEIDAKSANPDRALQIMLKKLQTGAELSKIMTKRVNYSDLDVNCHINNAKYGDLVCDAIHLEHGGFIREMQINYLAECRVGEEIELFASDDRTFVRGIGSDGDARFEAKISLT